MKKILLVVCICTILFAGSTVWAAIVTNPPEGWTYSNADTILGYDYLKQGNESQALAFANAVLAIYGMAPTELLNGTGMKVSFADGPKDITYDPGFAWVYAVVKVDGPNDYSYLFWNTYVGDGANLLQTPLTGSDPYNMGSPPYGISGITFFGPTSVPEPMTLLLLGLGLVGVAGVGRKLRK